MRALSVWVLIFSLYGCMTRDIHPLAPTGTNGDALIAGTIVEIQDMVPVDGGVTILILNPPGDTLVAFLPSLFTPQPVSPDDSNLYQMIQTLDIGMVVMISGDQTETGLRIRSIQRAGIRKDAQ